MNRRILLFSTFAAVCAISYLAATSKAESRDADKKFMRMEEKMKEIPDSLYEDVKVEDLLNDEVYLKLAHDGWSPREIMTIMETAVKDKKKAKEKFGYGYYAKQWRPAYGRSLGDDPLYQFVDTGLSVKTLASVIAAVGDDYNRSWDYEAYDPDARKKQGYVRKPGYFRQVQFNPSSGRTHWIVANQRDENGDSLYVVPDNAGIFRSDNGGQTWKCITDNIPDRANRSYSPGYSIPVDPDDWKHVFAFMVNNSVYETTDGGDTWRRVVGATHKNFKRGYCFRDKNGTLRFIGAQPNGNSGKLWISQDTCKTWTEVPVPAEFREEGNNNFWFQQVAFKGSHSDTIYFPGSRSILYMDDGGRGSIVNGKQTYTLKRMNLNITGKDNGNRGRNLQNQYVFPIEADGPGFLEINPLYPEMMFFAAGCRTDNRTALYYTDNGGKTWKTLHEICSNAKDSVSSNFGSGALFGNESPWNWLGGFGVQYNPKKPAEQPKNIFGCTMSSAYSTDGGRTFTEYQWGVRQKSHITKGLTNPSGASNSDGYYYVSASRHNADNHCIFSHVSGKVFRGGDGGFFVHDPAMSGEGKQFPFADWVNISSDMGQMLFYNIRCNEFGDQAIIGNTQDIDVQTYRYGRWGHWRGYEGCESSFNPYTSTGYFSGGGGGNAPDGMEPNSWHTARNYADVVTGSWFMLRTWSGDNTRSTLFRIDDIGNSLTDLYGAIGARVVNLALARDKGRLTVFVKTADNVIRMSTDSCKTFTQLVAHNGNPAAFSNTQMVCDPDDSNVLYLGQNGGKVLKYTVDNGQWEACGSGLPANITCNRLFFHEGSGDLYYCDYATGIYILKHGESQWRFWTKGYNNAKFNDCEINYTTQEMVLSDYGRGAWVADLETPADRYFKNGFKLKEISHRDGVRMFGIDTQWTIPMYYHYEWSVNGQTVDNPYQYLFVKDSKQIDNVQLKLTLREAPDVSTLSELYKVTEKTPVVPIARHQGNALHSTGEGRVDIGYMDWFYDDFSVEMWINPSNNGVIMSNSQLTVEKGAKGWVLYIENGVLKFKYYPSNVLQQPTYEVAMEQTAVVNGSPIAKDKWSHIAVTQERHGNICLYINGELVGEAKRIRDTEPHTLNNSVIMSLFGDAFEYNPIEASVDELKVWKKALTVDEIRREMFSTNLEESDDLVVHYDFNGETLADSRETFSGYSPTSRTRAVTTLQRMTVPVSANYVASAKLKQGENEFVSVKGGLPLIDIVAADNLVDTNIVVYGYEGNRWENPDDNLNETYYTPTQYGYMLRSFGALDENTTADVVFHNGTDKFKEGTAYRMYMADNAQDRMYWKQYQGKIVYDNGNLKLSGVKLSEIVDRKLLLVTMNPAIEMEIEGLSADGRIILYDDGHDKTKYNFIARLIEGKELSDNRYEIMSDSAVIVLPSEPLSFDNKNEAKGELSVDVDLIGDFNNTISTFIRGKNDDDMIPIPVDILNRITPTTLHNPIEIKNGCVRFGTATDFAKMKGSNHFTMMGWVRVDSETAITTGRNGDGVAPIMFFRSATGGDNNASGIHLKKGNIRYHWNDQYWSRDAETPFTIKKEDLGNWVHVALVVKPEGAWMYFNGMEHKMTGTPTTMPGCIAESPLLLGTNTQGNYTYFSGAFDHVAIWNRSLDKEEVHKYMQNRVLLNDPELMAYITMDEFDEAGRFKESVAGFTSNNHYGTVKSGDATPVPFAPFSREISLTDENCPIKLSSGATGCVSYFEGVPYNYISSGTEEQNYLPLNSYYYTLIYNSLQTSQDALTLTYNFKGLVDGETIALGIRRLGSTKPFTSEDYIAANEVKDGKAVFSVPAAKLSESSELMFFSTPNSVHRPTIVTMNFCDDSMTNGGTFLVDDTNREIEVNITVVSGSDPVSIVPTQSYVNVSKKDVDMTDPSQTVRLTIDTDQLRKINPFGLSDVTLQLAGVTADSLSFKVGLKPKVELSLKNGSDATHFEAKTPVSTLDIEAKLIEGYLNEAIKLKFSPEELNSAFSINSGSLLLNTPVTISDLKRVTSSESGLADGWNIIGNPYLMNINLTKSQNYKYEENSLTHFVYHNVEGSDNIVAFDMTDYDGDQHILPFQSYYVQTMTDNADFTVSNVAKETSLDRKTFDYYTANEVKGVTLKLLDDGDHEIDRTTVRWESKASSGYKLNEDAPKVRSVNGVADELFTLTSDDVATSINFVPDENRESFAVPVTIDVKTSGTKRFMVSRLTGFSEGDVETKGNHVVLVDANDDSRTLLKEGETYVFYADEGLLTKRFCIEAVFNDTTTGADGVRSQSPDYRIYTDNRYIRITGLQGNAVINIYNPSGMLMVHEDTDRSEFATAANSGAYIVRIIENGKEYVSKIIVK